MSSVKAVFIFFDAMARSERGLIAPFFSLELARRSISSGFGVVAPEGRGLSDVLSAKRWLDMVSKA